MPVYPGAPPACIRTTVHAPETTTWNRFWAPGIESRILITLRFDGVNAFSFAFGRENLQPRFFLKLTH
jgi:hypothetical protein